VPGQAVKYGQFIDVGGMAVAGEQGFCSGSSSWEIGGSSAPQCGHSIQGAVQTRWQL
jgi:hypothetical protein